MIRRRSHAGPIIAQIVGIGPVGDHVAPSSLGQRFELRVQLGLAVEAAIGIVGRIGRLADFVGVDHQVADADQLGHLAGLLPVRPRPGWRCVPVTATARSPRANWAALATTALSTPPE